MLQRKNHNKLKHTRIEAVYNLGRMNVLCQEVEGYTVMINRNDGSTREITQSMNF